MQSVPSWLARAKSYLLVKNPYYGSLLSVVRFVRDNSVPIMAVDRNANIYYNDNCEKFSTEENATVIEHELMHLILKHFDRQKGRNNKMWNLASDAEINEGLRRAGRKFPKDPIFPETLKAERNSTAEDYYSHLEKLRNKINKTSIDMKIDGGEKRDKQEDEDDSISGQSKEIGAKSKSGGGQDEKDEKGGKEDRGGGKKKSSEGIDIEDLLGGGGDMIDAPEESPARTEAIKAAINKTIKDIGKSSSAPREIKDLIFGKSKVNWRVLLRKVVKRAISSSDKSDYSYSRPSRRTDWLSSPTIISPRLIGRTAKLAIVVDVSGSMHDLKDAVISEIASIIKAVNTEVTIIYADDRIIDVVKVRNLAEFKKKKYYAGGGTDLRPAIARADKERPDLIIVITDCYTPWPQTKPRSNIVIVRMMSTADTPSWAKEVIDVMPE